jgi:hypothetical protein
MKEATQTMYEQKGDKLQNVPALGVIYTFGDDSVEIEFILVRIPTVP